MSKDNGSSVTYKIFSFVVLIILAFLFIFPLYWIITGMFKPPAVIIALFSALQFRLAKTDNG